MYVAVIFPTPYSISTNHSSKAPQPQGSISQFTRPFSPRMSKTSKRLAIVTGGNKGIGFEICKQLASNGITVILTARDEKKGLAAVEKLKQIDGISELLIFHQLDVADNQSIASFADFVKTQFGRLDILVNNAAVAGSVIDADGMARAVELAGDWPDQQVKEFSIQNYDLARQCLETNYYGTKSMIEAFVPLLKLSTSPRIVNVSSALGLFEYIPYERAKEVFSDIDNLTEEKVDGVLNEFLNDFKGGKLEAKGWPSVSAYKVSKASMNAYTRLLAKKYPNFQVNCVHPGFVRTDITCNTGLTSPAEGAENVVFVTLLPDDAPTGQFYAAKKVSSF